MLGIRNSPDPGLELSMSCIRGARSDCIGGSTIFPCHICQTSRLLEAQTKSVSPRDDPVMTKVALDGGKIVGSGVIHHGDPGECHHKLIIRFVQAQRYIC